MTPWLLLALAKHVAGKDTLVLSGTFYAVLAYDGAVISGVTPQAVLYDDPVAVSDTEVEWANLTSFDFDNTPAGPCDEVWVMDASSGGNVWFKVPKVMTLVDGGRKSFDARALTHNLVNTTA